MFIQCRMWFVRRTRRTFEDTSTPLVNKAYSAVQPLFTQKLGVKHPIHALLYSCALWCSGSLINVIVRVPNVLCFKQCCHSLLGVLRLFDPFIVPKRFRPLTMAASHFWSCLVLVITYQCSRSVTRRWLLLG